MTEIEQIKQEIKMLQSKLSSLEELEKHKTPVEEAFKDWWGEYPGTEIWCSYDETRWVGFQAGYEAAQPKDAEVKECPDKYVELPTLYEIVADWWKDNGGDRYACGWNDCLERWNLRSK